MKLFLLCAVAFAMPIAGAIPHMDYQPIAGQVEIDEDVVEAQVGLVLEAPDTCEVGELVRLDASKSDADEIVWNVLQETEDFEVIEDGRRALFSSRVPGSYLFMIAGAKGGKAFLLYKEITVIGEIDEDEPGPPMAYKIKKWLKLIPKYEGREAQIKAVGNVFKEMATDDEMSVDRILEATALANTAIIGDKLETWMPFLDKLGTELDNYVDDGSLETREQYEQLWLIIAKSMK